mmetsp:Transcript_16803/g.46964  ORF Transcript_16803/g.46964 Transcript_16803/m.46964 type:complete len:799 (-) Transcript_16803:479-2875(-)
MADSSAAMRTMLNRPSARRDGVASARPPAPLASSAVRPCGMGNRARKASPVLSRRPRVSRSAIAEPPSAPKGEGRSRSDGLKFEMLADTRPVPKMPSQIDVAAFVKQNFVPYEGDASFLAGATEKTAALWEKVMALMKAERERGGVLDCDPSVASTLTAFGPGFIDKQLDDVIVGLQCDAPLKRAIKPMGGVRMVNAALESYGFQPDPEITRIYSEVRKSHNQGVFDAYTDDMRAARKTGILTGLPDAYGRGRIIGDYRRVALYGTDALIKDKKQDLKTNLKGTMTDELIRLREEVSEQIRALADLAKMAATYGHDITRPAENAKEATQWLYYGYLGAVKQQDGAAMSMGRIDAFLDVFFERDLAEGRLTEVEAQEIIDHFVMKLRIVRQLRTPDYNDLFAGDPTWVTCVLGGSDSTTGSHMVTKTAFRILNTLYTLGPSPEPNLTVLWHPDYLPQPFKDYCAKVSVDTSSIQYENDMMMSQLFGSDYSIACCVSAMREGQDMQFFGARCNMPKLLLYVLNQGRDEVKGLQAGPAFPPVEDPTAPLNFYEVYEKLEAGLDWLVELYVSTMNCIHYMHDKYNYESLQMALHDTHVRRLLALGISGISVITDSLCAMKYAKVTPVLNDDGLMVDFNIEGDFPKYGNNDERADEIARLVVSAFSERMRKQHCYRGAMPTLSLLTITSNVVYGRKTGSTPDGRKAGEPFAPGANPMHGRDSMGALASLESVAKIPYTDCLDGISNTFSLVPSLLGKGSDEERHTNLANIVDGYFLDGGHHININVLDRNMLLDAMEHPDNYP